MPLPVMIPFLADCDKKEHNQTRLFWGAQRKHNLVSLQQWPDAEKQNKCITYYFSEWKSTSFLSTNNHHLD